MVGDLLENDYSMPKKFGMQARFLKRSGKDENTPECVADLAEILACAKRMEYFQDENVE